MVQVHKNQNPLLKNGLLKNKSVILFVILAGFFIANAIIAEFMGVKMFSLERTLGMEPVNLTILGNSGLSFNLSAGVLLWPVVFVMTDIINEYYGRRGVRFLSYLTVGLIIYGFIMYYFAITLTPADFWTTAHIDAAPAGQQAIIEDKVGDYNYAFQLIFGQGLWIIVGSLVAFLVGQLIDVTIFHRIKKITGEKRVWLRATGSTLFSQLIDSYIVLFIAFYFGANWELATVLAVGTVNYMYKFLMAIVLTPAIYFAHYLIDNYLGEELAVKMKQRASLATAA